jgi:hypothetical protein
MKQSLRKHFVLCEYEMEFTFLLKATLLHPAGIRSHER